MFFNGRIGRPDGYNTRSNGILISSDAPVEGHDGFFWDEFEETPVMSTYFLAWAVTDYTSAVSTASSRVNHQTWARREAIDAGYADYFLNEIEPRIIEYYEGLLGLDFPLDEMDQIGYPTKGGAMENWGLITYNEELVLYDESQTGAFEKENAVFYMTHENAHMWFGDLVTCEWWDAIWLNEGYADYICFAAMEEVLPEMGMWDSFYMYQTNDVMKYDGTTDSHPTIQVIEQASDADFGSITYARGSTINKFIAGILTQDTFVNGLSNYLAAHQFNNTWYDDLWDALTEAGHNEGTLDEEYDMEAIMSTFMEQMNYPLLTVNFDRVAGSATLTQSRFLTDPENADSSDDYRWYVPLTYKFVPDGGADADDAHITYFMEPGEEEITLGIGASDLPVLFNIDALGYMRVDYDEDNWYLLIDQLESDFTQISLNNRLALLSDSFALAEAGIQAYDLPLDLSQYLTQEDEYPVIDIAIDILKDLKESTNSDVAAMALEDYLESLLAVNYDAVGIEENTANSHRQHRYQDTVVSGVNYLELAAFDLDSADVFDIWMAAADPDDPAQNPVNRHIRPDVYCAAVRSIGQEAADFLQERRVNTFLPQVLNAITTVKVLIRSCIIFGGLFSGKKCLHYWHLMLILKRRECGWVVVGSHLLTSQAAY